jgi:hypothetical protein
VQAPDLRGKSLEEAQILAGGYRLVVVVGPPREDATLPPDTVAVQDPGVGTVLLSGDVITVSLNVRVQADPPPPTAAPPAPETAPQPPADSEGEAAPDSNRGKAKGQDKKKDENKKKEDD